MSATRLDADSEVDAAAAPASRSLDAVFNLATGVGLATMGSWSAAAQKIAPLLESPIASTWSVEDARALPEALARIMGLPREEFKAKLEIISSIGARVAELQQDAADSEAPFSESSHAVFRGFLAKLPLSRRPSIFLLDNGNLSVVWDNPEKELISLQFLGNGSVQYVIIRKQENSKNWDRASGVDTFAVVLAMLGNHERMI